MTLYMKIDEYGLLYDPIVLVSNVELLVASQELRWPNRKFGEFRSDDYPYEC